MQQLLSRDLLKWFNFTLTVSDSMATVSNYKIHILAVAEPLNWRHQNKSIRNRYLHEVVASHYSIALSGKAALTKPI